MSTFRNTVCLFALVGIPMFSLCPIKSLAQTGSDAEPVAYIGGEICNPRLHNGGLRYAIGTENIQVMRANRTHPNMADGFGWTYNHAPNLTFWQGKFYLAYLSNPKDEQQPPGHTLLIHSEDGLQWSKPEVVFPVYKAPEGVQIPKGYTGYIMHQRMNFYTASNGRLLILGFYGHSYNPFGKGGIGRVVREMKQDGTMGPIYFIKYSSYTTWNPSNTSFPYFTDSKDSGFVAACNELLKDSLRTLQWIDEDREQSYFSKFGEQTDKLQATSYYHRKDGNVVALWKWSYAAISTDEGHSWSSPVKIPSFIMAGGKQWGQRTSDGRFAVCYNPIETQPYRYPLIVITSNDGVVYDSMSVVHGEVPPRRFMGENKDFGPCYVRGIAEGEQQPNGDYMWVTYSVNKEDIWVSRIPVPIRQCWKGDINDDFVNNGAGVLHNWNIYRPLWCPIYLNERQRLCMSDSDPYDYARAIRVFEPSANISVEIGMTVEEEHEEPFQLEISDRYDTRPVCLSVKDGEVRSGKTVVDHYRPGQPFIIRFLLKNNRLLYGNYSLPYIHAVNKVERLSFRTGNYRIKPDRNTPNQTNTPPLDGCDNMTKRSAYSIDFVRVKQINS